MRNLYGVQIIQILAVLLMTGSHADAQRGKGYNYLDFESKDYYFGLTIGYNSSNFQILHSQRFVLNDSFSVADPKPGPGFNVSMVTNLKIGDYFDFQIDNLSQNQLLDYFHALLERLSWSAVKLDLYGLKFFYT